jgi:hypothetical protein
MTGTNSVHREMRNRTTYRDLWTSLRVSELKVCTGQNFRISPGPARGASGPSSKFVFKYVTRTPPKPDFLLFQPEWSPIYLQPALTIASLRHFYFNAQLPVILELFNAALRTSEVILAFEERYKDIRCQVWKVLSRTISGRGQLRKSPRKSSRWDLFPEPDLCHGHKMSATTNNVFFEKKEWPEKARNILRLIVIIWTRPETRPDPNIVCATRPGPRVGSGRAEARADLWIF